MKCKVFGLFIFLVIALMMAGCSSNKPMAGTSGVEQSAQMAPTESKPQAMAYRNPAVDVTQYKQVILLPVDIYTGPDAEFKNVTPEEQQQLATHLYDEMTKQLKEKNLYTTQPGPGVARLKLILGGVEKTRPVASGVTHLLPIGLAVNLGKGALGKNGRFMGTATVGGEFTDSTTGTLIASFLMKEAPNAMNIPAAFTEFEASKAALDKVAQEVSDRIYQAGTGTKVG